MKRYPVLVGAVLVCLICCPHCVYADQYLKYRTHTDSVRIMGQIEPARDTVQEIWIASDRMRSDSQEHSMIVRLDKKVMYILNHTEKIYTSVPLDGGEEAGDIFGDEEDMTPEERQTMREMAQAMIKVNIIVVETGEKKRINNWNCREYIMKTETMMGPFTSEIWASQDIEMNYDLFARFNAAHNFALNPALQGSLSQAMEEMTKIKGVTVFSASTANMIGARITSTQELLEFSDGTAPEGSFAIPRGYAKETFGE